MTETEKLASELLDVFYDVDDYIGLITNAPYKFLQITIDREKSKSLRLAKHVQKLIIDARIEENKYYSISLEKYQPKLIKFEYDSAKCPEARIYGMKARQSEINFQVNGRICKLTKQKEGLE